MTEPVRISRKRKVEHQDPDAAGFTEGYVWEVDTPHFGTITSAAPTREAAEAAAAEVARKHGVIVA